MNAVPLLATITNRLPQQQPKKKRHHPHYQKYHHQYTSHHNHHQLQQYRLLIVLLIQVQFFARFQLAKAGACWSSIVRNGRCLDALSLNSTKEDCCGAAHHHHQQQHHHSDNINSNMNGGSSNKNQNSNNNIGLTIGWSDGQLDSGTLFFLTMLSGGVPCSPCRVSCDGYDCGTDRKCVVRDGRPRCVCAPKCRDQKRRRRRRHGASPSSTAVCGTDGRTYKSLCRLRKRACKWRKKKKGNGGSDRADARSDDSSNGSSVSSDIHLNNGPTLAYYGPCQSSCDRIRCPSGRHCLLDQNLGPHCVKCSRKCSADATTSSTMASSSAAGWWWERQRQQVCGADGVTYSSACHLRERACRKGKAIPIAYKGPCKRGATCDVIRCKDRQTCLEDPNGRPRCVTCTLACRPRHMNGPICGTNNSTYQSWCHMIQDACHRGHVIETRHSGRCHQDGRLD